VQFADGDYVQSPVFIYSSRIIHSYLNTHIERKSMENRSNIYAKFMHNT